MKSFFKWNNNIVYLSVESLVNMHYIYKYIYYWTKNNEKRFVYKDKRLYSLKYPWIKTSRERSR